MAAGAVDEFGVDGVVVVVPTVALTTAVAALTTAVTALVPAGEVAGVEPDGSVRQIGRAPGAPQSEPDLQQLHRISRRGEREAAHRAGGAPVRGPGHPHPEIRGLGVHHPIRAQPQPLGRTHDPAPVRMAENRQRGAGALDLHHPVDLAAETDQPRGHRLREVRSAGIGHDVLRELAVEVGHRHQAAVARLHEILDHIGVDVRHVQVGPGPRHVHRDRLRLGSRFAHHLDHAAAPAGREREERTTTTTRPPRHGLQPADPRTPRRARQVLAVQRPAHGHRVGPRPHRPRHPVGAADDLGLRQRQHTPVRGAHVLDRRVHLGGVGLLPRLDGGAGVDPCARHPRRERPGQTGQVGDRVVHGAVQPVPQAAALRLGERVWAVEIVPAVLRQLDQPIHAGQELGQAAGLTVDRVGELRQRGGGPRRRQQGVTSRGQRVTGGEHRSRQFKQPCDPRRRRVLRDRATHRDRLCG